MEKEEGSQITPKHRRLKLEQRFNRHRLTNEIAKEKDFCTLGSMIRESAAPLLKALDGQLDSNGHQERQMRKAALSLERKRKIHASLVPEKPDKRLEILKMNHGIRLKPIELQRARYTSQITQETRLVDELKNRTKRKHLPNSPASRTQ